MKNLFDALSKFQSKVKNPSKEKKGVHGANYAPIEVCWDEARALLGEFGLSLIQFPISKTEDQKYYIGLRSILTHSSGESLTDEFYFPQILIDAQKVGGTITYLRRYSACSILGITPENDDLDGDNIDTQAVKKAHDIVNKSSIEKSLAPGAKIFDIPFGDDKGKKFSEVPISKIISAVAWAKKNGKFLDFVEKAEKYIKEKETINPDTIPF